MVEQFNGQETEDFSGRTMSEECAVRVLSSLGTRDQSISDMAAQQWKDEMAVRFGLPSADELLAMFRGKKPEPQQPEAPQSKPPQPKPDQSGSQQRELPPPLGTTGHDTRLADKAAADKAAADAKETKAAKDAFSGMNYPMSKEIDVKEAYKTRQFLDSIPPSLDMGRRDVECLKNMHTALASGNLEYFRDCIKGAKIRAVTYAVDPKAVLNHFTSEMKQLGLPCELSESKDGRLTLKIGTGNDQVSIDENGRCEVVSPESYKSPMKAFEATAQSAIKKAVEKSKARSGAGGAGGAG